MKKIIKEVKGGIVQVTVADERWYLKSQVDEKTKLPAYKGVPSVTWIAGFYPKGIQFYKWLAEKGWDESQAIKSAAGDKGSKVHYACEDIVAGKAVKMEDKYVNPSTGEEEELTLEEYEAVLSFADWLKDMAEKFKDFEVVSSEEVVWNDEYGYAGTVDLAYRADGKLWIVDLKTGQYIWPEHKLQVSAYKHAYPADVSSLAILQLGYHRNQRLWKLTEVDDEFDLFLTARKIWEKEVGDQKPSVKDYPVEIQINVKWAKVAIVNKINGNGRSSKNSKGGGSDTGVKTGNRKSA